MLKLKEDGRHWEIKRFFVNKDVFLQKVTNLLTHTHTFKVTKYIIRH